MFKFIHRFFEKIIKLFKKKNIQIPLREEQQFVQGDENWPIIFARCFRSEDGQKVLSYLRFITLDKSLGSTATNESLRFNEGRRSLVTLMQSYVHQGRQSGS